MVKSNEKYEFTKKLLMNSQTLKVVDCHDVSEQPSYDIELKTDAKVYFLSLGECYVLSIMRSVSRAVKLSR